jgi:hypothetical protein
VQSTTPCGVTDASLEAAPSLRHQPVAEGLSPLFPRSEITHGLIALSEAQGRPIKTVPVTWHYLAALVWHGQYVISGGNVAAAMACSYKTACSHINDAITIGLVTCVAKTSKGFVLERGPAMQSDRWAELCRKGRINWLDQQARNDQDRHQGEGLDRTTTTSNRKRLVMGKGREKLSTLEESSTPTPSSSTGIPPEESSGIKETPLYSLDEGSYMSNDLPKGICKGRCKGRCKGICKETCKGPLALPPELDEEGNQVESLLTNAPLRESEALTWNVSAPLRSAKTFQDQQAPVIQFVEPSPLVESNMNSTITYGSVVSITDRPGTWIVKGLHWGDDSSQDIARCASVEDESTWITSRISDVALVDPASALNLLHAAT